MISVTSTPTKVCLTMVAFLQVIFCPMCALVSQNISLCQVYKAVDACKNVLRGLHTNKIAQRELDRVCESLAYYF